MYLCGRCTLVVGVAYHILYKKVVFSLVITKKEIKLCSNRKYLPVNFVLKIFPVNAVLPNILGSINLVIIFGIM